MGTLPAYLWVISVVAILVVVSGISFILYAGSRATGAPPHTATRLAATAGSAYTAWLLLVMALGGAGLFIARPNAVPWVVPFMLGWIALCLWTARQPAVARALQAPHAVVWLTAIQFARGIAGAAFLLALAIDGLPPVFAIPAGLGDLAVGIAAPVVALSLWRHPDRIPSTRWFHRLGLADVLVFVPLGALASPAFALFGPDTTVQMGMLPLVVLALAGAPTMFALHLITLNRLRAPRVVHTVQTH